jgi:glycine cleavage system aminomethyltransferase T
LAREYQVVTNKCGVIDLSWKGKIEVRGRDATPLMNFVLANEAPPVYIFLSIR